MKPKTMIWFGVGLFFVGMIVAGAAQNAGQRFLESIFTVAWLVGIGYVVAGIRGVLRARKARQAPGSPS